MKALTRTELDRMGCMEPGCAHGHGPMYFHGRCHPHKGCVASYQNGAVVLECAACKRLIARVAVAPGKDEP